MADFKVQRGTISVADGSATTTLTAGVDYTAPAALSRAFIRVVGIFHCGAPTADSFGTSEKRSFTITNPENLLTSVTLSRTSSSGGVQVEWELVEYIGPAGGANEFVVRDQAKLTYTASSNTKDTAQVAGVVTDADVMVLLTGVSEISNQYGIANWGITAAWNNSPTSTATFTREINNVTAVTFSYAIVEFTGANWKVQRVLHSYSVAGNTETETITEVGSTSKVFLHVQHRASSNQKAYTDGRQVWLSSATQVSFLMSANGSVTNAKSVAWVVENTQTGTGLANCQHISGDYAGGTGQNITITAVADTAQTSIWGECATCDEDVTAPKMVGTFKLTTTTNVFLYRKGTGGDLHYRFDVFEWPTAPLSGNAGSQRGLERGIDRGLNRGLA